MPPLETFIELELALGKLLHRRWERAAAKAWPAISASWARDDFQTAIEQIGAIQQEPHTVPEIRKARVLCNAMLAYGASFVSEARGKKWIGPQMDHEPTNLMLRQMETLAVEDAPAFAVRTARAEIKRQAKEKEGGPEALFLQLVAKEDIPSSYQARNVIMSGGRWSSDLTANLVTSRLVNYGSLDGMVDEGIRTYQLKATLDARTSHICRTLDGRTFTVREGFRRVEAALRTEDGATLREVHPWIPNNMAETLPKLSRREMTEQGWLVPPFHPRCRTIVIPAAFNEVDVEDLFDDIADPADVLFGRRTGSLLSNGWVRAAIGVTLTGATVVGSIVLFDLLETGLLARTFRNVGSRLLSLRSWQIDDIVSDVTRALRSLSVNGVISPVDFDRAVRSTLSRFADIDPSIIGQVANDVMSGIEGIVRR